MPKFEILLDVCETYCERVVVEAATLEEAEDLTYSTDGKQEGGKVVREIIQVMELPA